MEKGPRKLKKILPGVVLASLLTFYFGNCIPRSPAPEATVATNPSRPTPTPTRLAEALCARLSSCGRNIESCYSDVMTSTLLGSYLTQGFPTNTTLQDASLAEAEGTSFVALSRLDLCREIGLKAECPLESESPIAWSQAVLSKNLTCQALYQRAPFRVSRFQLGDQASHYLMRPEPSMWIEDFDNDGYSDLALFQNYFSTTLNLFMNFTTAATRPFAHTVGSRLLFGASGRFVEEQRLLALVFSEQAGQLQVAKLGPSFQFWSSPAILSSTPFQSIQTVRRPGQKTDLLATLTSNNSIQTFELSATPQLIDRLDLPKDHGVSGYFNLSVDPPRWLVLQNYNSAIYQKREGQWESQVLDAAAQKMTALDSTLILDINGDGLLDWVTGNNVSSQIEVRTAPEFQVENRFTHRLPPSVYVLGHFELPSHSEKFLVVLVEQQGFMVHFIPISELGRPESAWVIRMPKYIQEFSTADVNGDGLDDFVGLSIDRTEAFIFQQDPTL